ncbi:MAG: hypothetical protein J2P28_12735 [Actinobacteria bacterium]|nr:hypothetical protein [Actinomycetota bacterium]
MTTDRPQFQVLSTAQVRRRYRLVGVQAEEVEFDEGAVPASVKHLIPLARVWGIADDVLRDDMRQAADPEALKELKRAVAEVDDDLDEWLTSPDALSNGPTPAYLAFTNLRMVADAVRG